jgi:hypothetical protein
MINNNNSLAFDRCGDILVLSQVQCFRIWQSLEAGCGSVLKAWIGMANSSIETPCLTSSWAPENRCNKNHT